MDLQKGTFVDIRVRNVGHDEKKGEIQRLKEVKMEPNTTAKMRASRRDNAHAT